MRPTGGWGRVVTERDLMLCRVGLHGVVEAMELHGLRLCPTCYSESPGEAVWTAHLHAVDGLESTGCLSELLAELDSLETAFGDAHPSLRLRLNSERARLLPRVGRLDAAREAARCVTDADDLQIAAMHLRQLARLLLAAGDHDTAVRTARSAVALVRDSPGDLIASLSALSDVLEASGGRLESRYADDLARSLDWWGLDPSPGAALGVHGAVRQANGQLRAAAERYAAFFNALINADETEAVGLIAA